MKRRLISILLLTVAFALVGCNNTSNEKDSDAEYSDNTKNSYNDALKFYSEYVVFVPTSELSHKYSYADSETGETKTTVSSVNSYHNHKFVKDLDSNEYKACTIEEAKNMNYVPCSICFGEDKELLPDSAKKGITDMVTEEDIEKAKEELKNQQHTYVYNNETGKMETKDE